MIKIVFKCYTLCIMLLIATSNRLVASTASKLLYNACSKWNIASTCSQFSAIPLSWASNFTRYVSAIY